MPIALHLIRASEFIRLDADEQIDFEASKRVLQDLAVACRKRGIGRAMVDIRNMPVPDKPRFTHSELAALAGAFREAGFTREQRLAILYKNDVYGGVRHFTFFTKLRGLQVQAFDQFEDAFFWLTQEQPVELKQGDNVPIFKSVGEKPAEQLAGGIEHPPVLRPIRRMKRHL